MDSYPKPAAKISGAVIDGKVNESPSKVGIDGTKQPEGAGQKQIVSGGSDCAVKGFTGGGVINGKV
jgi:hypothetical protein